MTLVEVIVVMVLLLIAAAMVVPNVSSTEETRVSSAARMLMADMEYAQNVAITYQSPVTVTFDVAAESYSLSNASGPLTHPTSKDAYTVDLTAIDELRGCEIISANFAGGGSITFDELGTPDNAGDVIVQAGDYPYRLSVAAATGKLTVNYTGS